MALFLKNLLFTVLVPGTVAVAVPWLIAGRAPPASPSVTVVTRWIAAPFLATGAAVYLWCLWDFAAFGRGTPAPLDAPKRLVVRGLYRIVRNPMYLGVLLLIGGWALGFGSPRVAGYGAVMALAFHLMVVLYEEPALRRAFGDQYGDYLLRVNRWLPRIPRKPGRVLR